MPIASSLAARVAPGGMLVLSGLLAGEEAAIKSAYATLRFVRMRTSGDWISLLFERPA